MVNPLLATLPRIPVKGAVKAELTVMEIDAPELAVAVSEKRPKRRRRI